MDTRTLPDSGAVTAKEQAQWMLHRLVPDRGICNIGFAVRVDRHLRWWPLQQALNRLLRRHPALRAVFAPDGAALGKRFLPPDTDFPLTTEAATEQGLDRTLTALAARPFALDGGQPLARAHLVLLPGASVACVVFHHLVADYTSAAILLGQLASLYDSFAAAGLPTPELAGPAPVHAEPPADPATVGYWVRHLDGVDPAAMAMAAARPIAGRPTFAGARIDRAVCAAGVEAVRRIQRHVRLTQNVVLLAAFYLLLARHGAGPDLVVGIPVNGRRGTGAGAVGFHANTLPVRVRVDDRVAVAELVRRTCREFLTGMEHDTASFETIHAALEIRSGDWRTPLFRHMFNYRPAIPPTLRIGGAPVGLVEVSNGMSRLDLEWIVWGAPDSIHIGAVYSTEVHDEGFVATLLERYDALLVQLADALEEPVGSVPAWSAADRAAVERLNATARPVPAASAPQLVLDVARRRPEAAAVELGDRSTSCAALVATADAVCAELARRGVAPGDTVGLLAGRGPRLAAAALGVWAAGAAYLPLDPGHPPRRLAAQLDDAGVRVLLCDADPDQRCGSGRDVVMLDEPHAPAAGGGVPQWRVPAPDSVAYVIYTSGSTGEPKGVRVTHANLTNLLDDFAARLGAAPGDRTLWLTTFSFDISALELWLPLTTGGTAVVAPDEIRPDADALLDLVADRDVAIVQATPTTWRHLSGRLRDRLRGRRVVSGGEPLTAPLAEALLAGGCRLFNVYGPTETTIWSTAVELAAPVPEPVPIGTPIANTTVHVLAPDGRPVPPGLPGELFIGGAGVALGYHGRPRETADRFPEDTPYGRIYRTGDQVRLDGAAHAPVLVFLGRLDRQVKVRGHRIEVPEVEAVLEAHPRVRAAAVVTEPDGAGHLRLVAAVQPADPPDGQEGLADRLRAWAAQRLPDAAVPGRFAVLPELPLTGNGKVDHREVAALLRRAVAAGAPVPEAGEPPADPVLAALVGLWRELLGDDRLGATANFFLNGGHSLLAADLTDRVAAVLGVEVGFDAVFDAPTPARLAALLADRREGVRP